jgi:hypothetical protein
VISIHWIAAYTEVIKLPRLRPKRFCKIPDNRYAVSGMIGQ